MADDSTEYLYLITLELVLEKRPTDKGLIAEREKVKSGLELNSNFKENYDKLKKEIRENKNEWKEVFIKADEIAQLRQKQSLEVSENALDKLELQMKKSLFYRSKRYFSEISKLVDATNKKLTGFKPVNEIKENGSYFLCSGTQLSESHYRNHLYSDKKSSLISFSSSPETIRIYKYIDDKKTGFIDFKFDAESKLTSISDFGAGLIIFKELQTITKAVLYQDPEKFIERVKGASNNPYSAGICFILGSKLQKNILEQLEINKVLKTDHYDNIEYEADLS